MDIKNHNKGRKKPVMGKPFQIAVFTAVLLGIVLMVFRYFGFVSKTVYEESVSHLTEVFHQSDNMLRELTDKNLTYLHMWGENLQNTSSEDEIRNYIKKAQEDAGFLDFFFLSADGDYKMATGGAVGFEPRHGAGRHQAVEHGRLCLRHGIAGAAVAAANAIHNDQYDRFFHRYDLHLRELFFCVPILHHFPPVYNVIF